MSNTAKGILAIIVIIIVVCTLYFGLGERKVQVLSGEEVKIGVILSLTGTSADASANIKHGIDLAARDINSDSARRNKISLIYEDDKYDSKEAVNSINKLLNLDKVKYIIGSYGSSQVLAIAPIAEKNKAVMIVPSAQSNKIGEAGEYIFHMNSNTRQEAGFWGPYLAQKIGKNKLAILSLDSDLGTSYIADLQSIYPRAGGQLGLIQKFDKKETDFRTMLLKIKDAKTRDVLLIGNRQMNGTILKQAKELNYPFNFFATSVTEGKELITVAGLAAEGLIYPYYFDDNSVDPVQKDFQDKYLATYGTKSEVTATHGYDALMVLSNCFEKVGVNPELVKACITQTRGYSGVGGNISFDSNRDVSRSMIVKTVKDGQFVPLGQ